MGVWRVVPVPRLGSAGGTCRRQEENLSARGRSPRQGQAEKDLDAIYDPLLKQSSDRKCQELAGKSMNLAVRSYCRV